MRQKWTDVEISSPRMGIEGHMFKEFTITVVPWGQNIRASRLAHIVADPEQAYLHGTPVKVLVCPSTQYGKHVC